MSAARAELDATLLPSRAEQFVVSVSWLQLRNCAIIIVSRAERAAIWCMCESSEIFATTGDLYQRKSPYNRRTRESPRSRERPRTRESPQFLTVRLPPQMTKVLPKILFRKQTVTGDPPKLPRGYAKGSNADGARSRSGLRFLLHPIYRVEGPCQLI